MDLWTTVNRLLVLRLKLNLIRLNKIRKCKTLPHWRIFLLESCWIFFLLGLMKTTTPMILICGWNWIICVILMVPRWWIEPTLMLQYFPLALQWGGKCCFQSENPLVLHYRHIKVRFHIKNKTVRAIPHLDVGLVSACICIQPFILYFSLYLDGLLEHHQVHFYSHLWCVWLARKSCIVVLCVCVCVCLCVCVCAQVS